jgi:hypothetical protein
MGVKPSGLTVMCKMDIFIAGANHTVENIALVLLTKWRYQITSKIHTKISDRFRAFPWPLQSNSEPEILP